MLNAVCVSGVGGLSDYNFRFLVPLQLHLAQDWLQSHLLHSFVVFFFKHLSHRFTVHDMLFPHVQDNENYVPAVAGLLWKYVQKCASCISSHKLPLQWKANNPMPDHSQESLWTLTIRDLIIDQSPLSVHLCPLVIQEPMSLKASNNF